MLAGDLYFESPAPIRNRGTPTTSEKGSGERIMAMPALDKFFQGEDGFVTCLSGILAGDTILEFSE